MNDLAENMSFEAAYEPAPADEIIERTSTVFNGTINSTLQSSVDQDFDRNNDALRLLLITIAIIIVLVCITISTILFIFICLNRYVQRLVCVLSHWTELSSLTRLCDVYLLLEIISRQRSRRRMSHAHSLFSNSDNCSK